MISVDDAPLIVGQAQLMVDSPETVAVYSIVIAAAAVAGMAGMTWACLKGHRRHLEDLRTLIPALEENTHVLSEVVRTVDRHVAAAGSWRREGDR